MKCCQNVFILDKVFLPLHIMWWSKLYYCKVLWIGFSYEWPNYGRGIPCIGYESSLLYRIGSHTYGNYPHVRGRTYISNS